MGSGSSKSSVELSRKPRSRDDDDGSNTTSVLPPSSSSCNLPNSEWKQKLDPLTYHITREKGTEPPFTGKYYMNSRTGIYNCACCDQSLFSSSTKYESGSGWPSFYQCLQEQVSSSEESDGCINNTEKTVVIAGILRVADNTGGMLRTEIQCANCGSHLGHEFRDGPEPTGTRFCVNSAALQFIEKEKKNIEKNTEEKEDEVEREKEGD